MINLPKSSRRLLVVCLAAALLTPGTALAKGADKGKKPEETLHNLALGKPYTIEQGVKDNQLMAYEIRTSEDSGSAYELTDGRIAEQAEPGESYFQNKNWIGFNRQVSRTVTIDLGEPSYIQRIYGGYLQERAAAIDLPRYIRYAVSDDGQRWYDAGTQKPNYSDSQAASRKVLASDDIEVVARYVKVEFEVGMFTFVDELEVWGRPAERKDKSANTLPKVKPPKDAAPPTRKETGGVSNMYIAYYYPVGSGNEALGRWYKDDFKSIIAHTDSQGERTGWMFDTILFSNGGNVYTDYNTKEKWQTYLDQLFTDGTNIGALDQATAEAKEALGDRKRKTKVVISIPYPNPDPDRVWGELNGKTIDFDIAAGEQASLEARLEAVSWYVDTAVRMFESKRYEHVELAGFYWQHEEVGFRTLNEENLLKQVSAFIHKKHVKFYWIPFFQANGSTIWKELGFDAVMMQPNYYFSSAFAPNVQSGAVDTSRLEAAVETAKRFGMGIEIEGDYHIAWDGWGTDYDGQLYNGDYAIRKYFAYLNESKKAELDGTITGYYLGARTVLPSIIGSSKPEVRDVYDETFR
jgi:hypothetical protein